MSELFIWFHWSVCLFLCQWYAVFIILVLLSNDIRDDYTYSNYFSIQECLSHPRHFMVHMKLIIFHKLMVMPHCWAWRSHTGANIDPSLLHISTFSTGGVLCSNKAQQTATQSQTLWHTSVPCLIGYYNGDTKLVEAPNHHLIWLEAFSASTLLGWTGTRILDAKILDSAGPYNKTKYYCSKKAINYLPMTFC